MKLSRRSTVLLSLAVLNVSVLAACSQAPQTQTAQTVPAADTTTQTSNVSNAPSKFTQTATTTTQSQPAQPKASAPRQATGLAAGDYCYEHASKTSTAHAKVTVSNGNQLSGQLKGQEHNEAASYYTGVGQNFQGTLAGNQATLDIQTQVEGETRTSKEVWTMNAKTLTTKNITLQKISCTKFGQLPTPAMPGGSASSGYSKPVNKRISFAKGASSTVIQDAAVRGEWHTYLINAGKGQNMKINLTAVENNGTFSVKSPSGKDLAMASDTALNQVLPETGDYQISVGPTRGNASYTMTIEIQ